MLLREDRAGPLQGRVDEQVGRARVGRGIGVSILVQAAALIRSTGKAYLAPHSDFILSYIARNEAIASGALDGRLVQMAEEDEL